MILVTTALEETWPEGEPLLFLGEWCLRFSRKGQWSALNAAVVPYHWDDRGKLYADFGYLQKVYEKFLEDLGEHLNQIHKVDYSTRYWRILVGPWLGYFLQMLFDRWESIQQAVNGYDVSGTIILTGDENAVVPNDMAHFRELYVGDVWNHNLYASILRQFTTVPCIEQNRRNAPDFDSAAQPITWGRWVRIEAARLYGRFASALTSDEDAFFLSTYLPKIHEMRLSCRLGQIPQAWRPQPVVRTKVEWASREWILRGECRNEFEACARALISKHIPTAYLEGYQGVVKQTQELPWPRRPKLIWTSNAFSADDIFKVWAAQKVEAGTPFVIGQHGGHYGIGKWSFTEDHEIAISDCYLTWGWVDSLQPKTKAVGQLKGKRPLGIRHAAQSGALLVTATLPRQSYFMYSVAVSRQWLDYFDDQCVFVGQLPAHIRSVLTVRLYAQDYGWDQVARWHDRFPGLHLDEGSPINSLLRKTRLYISTYNATTFLESFTMDIPTVIFWNPKHWELRESAIPFFEDLKRVGIFHETPSSAAQHVSRHWGNVEDWWASSEVREVLRRFKTRYCYLPDNLLARVEGVLREVINRADTSLPQ